MSTPTSEFFSWPLDDNHCPNSFVFEMFNVYILSVCVCVCVVDTTSTARIFGLAPIFADAVIVCSTHLSVDSRHTTQPATTASSFCSNAEPGEEVVVFLGVNEIGIWIDG